MGRGLWRRGSWVLLPRLREQAVAGLDLLPHAGDEGADLARVRIDHEGEALRIDPVMVEESGRLAGAAPEGQPPAGGEQFGQLLLDRRHRGARGLLKGRRLLRQAHRQGTAAEPDQPEVEVGIDRVYGAIKSGKLFVFNTLMDGLLEELGTYSRELDELRQSAFARRRFRKRREDV